MAQFRLTKKFATDMKVNQLHQPNLITSLFDDWFVDVIRVKRKKVAMATHAKSLLTFLLPYEQIGGAKSVPDCIGVSLNLFLNEHDLNISTDQIDILFSQPPIFCKTDNRKILGHMNDFKHCVEASIFHDDLNFSEVDWDEIMSSINRTPVGTQGYQYPIEMAKALFSGSAVA